MRFNSAAKEKKWNFKIRFGFSRGLTWFMLHESKDFFLFITNQEEYQRNEECKYIAAVWFAVFAVAFWEENETRVNAIDTQCLNQSWHWEQVCQCGTECGRPTTGINQSTWCWHQLHYDVRIVEPIFTCLQREFWFEFIFLVTFLIFYFFWWNSQF